MDDQEFVPVPGFPNTLISRSGVVRSKLVGVRKLKPGRQGYVRVTLRHQGRTYNVGVHRLVLETFVGPCPPGKECRHLDGDPTNNHLDNLVWGTRVENALDRRRHGTHRTTSKLTVDDVQEIRRALASGQLCTAIAGRYGVTAKTIMHIRNSSTWSDVPWEPGLQEAAMAVLPNRGSTKPDAKLSEADIPAIREAYSLGEGTRKLAARYGMNKKLMRDIVLGRRWAHVPWDPRVKQRVDAMFAARDPDKFKPKLDRAAAQEIRRRLADGESLAEVAERCGVSRYTVARIRDHRLWASA